MPGYRVHLVAGFISYLGILQILKYSDISHFVLLQGLLFCLLGSLFPDIDIKSKGQKIFYTLLLLLLLTLIYKQMHCACIVMSLMSTAPLLVNHRGIFHNLLFLMSCTLLLMMGISFWCQGYAHIMMYNCLFFFVGSVSHVFMDRLISKLKRYF